MLEYMARADCSEETTFFFWIIGLLISFGANESGSGSSSTSDSAGTISGSRDADHHCQQNNAVADAETRLVMRSSLFLVLILLLSHEINRDVRYV